MNTAYKPSILLRLTLSCLGLLTAALVSAETTITTTTTNPDGSTTTVQETTAAPATAETAPPPPPAQTATPNLVGPTGATGTIRRSDRRQDRRAGDPRID